MVWHDFLLWARGFVKNGAVGGVADFFGQLLPPHTHDGSSVGDPLQNLLR